MNRRYTYSVIVPFYNAECYLEEAINSVVSQTIGFDNIQLILVNDGSPDNSDRICKRYLKLYPDNIVYIEKENGGVSSARNEGLKHAEGDYVAFLDADDRWDSAAFANIAEFFESYGDSFDVCCCRIKFTGDYESREHPLDYRFDDGARAVDLMEEPVMVSSTIGNSVFRRKAISSMKFEEALAVGEDSVFVNSVLLNKPVLGILPDAVYYYRRMLEQSGGSSSATSRKSWYLDVPRDFYGRLCSISAKKYGKVPPFIQHVILYDMRWRFNRTKAESILSEDEKHEYLETLHQIVKDFDPEIINSVKGIDQYKKLYYMQLKYGRPVAAEAEISKHALRFDDRQLTDLHRPTIFHIAVLEIEDGCLRIEGITRASVIQRPYRLFADDGEHEYELRLSRYEAKDIKGFIGDSIVDTEAFLVNIPVREGLKIAFYLSADGKKIKLRPGYRPYICHLQDAKEQKYENAYCTKGGWLIKCGRQGLSVCRESKRTVLAAEIRLLREVFRKSGETAVKDRLAEALLESNIRNSKIKKQVAFITVRSDDELNENMKGIYDMLDVPKVKFAKKDLADDKRLRDKAAKLIYSSKVVVTDDYLPIFRDYGKKEGQYFVQLWHATGAGKRFGKDGGRIIPQIDRLFHKNYDLVTVSGEASRVAFASAFDLPLDRLQSVGVARTDALFDKEKCERMRRRDFEAHPELSGRQIILYTPTFRDGQGLRREIFKPALDFKKLSAELLPGQVFVVKPHPVMTEPIVGGSYDNVIEIRDIGTNDLMIASDLMITDYSSTFFEYALLKKPMAFFCYDYEEYDRDFYIDFDTELPGEILRTQEELFAYLRQEEHPILDSYDSFYEKYMGACDGHSTVRTAELIKEMLNK